MTDRRKVGRARTVQPRYLARIAHQYGERSHRFPWMKRQEADENVEAAAGPRREQETGAYRRRCTRTKNKNAT